MQEKIDLRLYTELPPRPPGEPEFRIGGRVRHGKDRGFVQTIHTLHEAATGQYMGYRYDVCRDEDRKIRKNIPASELISETWSDLRKP